MSKLKSFLFSCISKPNKISCFSMVLLSSLIVILLTPILARNCANSIIIGLMILTVASLFPIYFHLKKSTVITLIALVAYLTIITIYKLSGISSAALYYYFNTIQFFFFLGVGIVIIPSLNNSQKKFLCLLICATIIFTCLHNIILYFIHGAEDYVLLFRHAKYTTNSINTPYVTSVMLLTALPFIWGIDKQRSTKTRVIAIVISFLGFLFIAFIAQRMISVIFCIFMGVLILLSKQSGNRLKQLPQKKRLLLGFIVLMAIILLFILAVPVLELIRSAIPSPRIAQRLTQIIRFLKTGDIHSAGGSLSIRYQLIETSFRTFTSSVSNFFLGVGDHRLSNAIIGNHSYIFDELARYGILFAPISFFLVYRSLFSVYKHSDVFPKSVLSRQLISILIVVALRTVIGTIFDASIGAVLFIAIPLAFQLLQNKQHCSTIKGDCAV